MAPPGRSHNPRVTTPIRLTSRRFGLFPVRSPLLGESLLISVPPGTEMFHFPGLAPSPLWIQDKGSVASPQWVAPFGNPRINARSQLPEAYRSRPRPSSPPDAKASTVRPCSLDHSSHLEMYGPSNPTEFAQAQPDCQRSHAARLKGRHGTAMEASLQTLSPGSHHAWWR
jgi:hypothetical protein